MKRRQSYFQKTWIFTLILFLIFANTALADTTNNNQNNTTNVQALSSIKMDFSDVSKSYWGYQYITKMALLGVVQGDKGNFNPDKEVSKQEAVIMAIRMMGLEAEAKQQNSIASIPFSVADWAKADVVEALNKGLLNLQEETQSNDASQSWGTTSASREWVAELVIRAIGMEADAKSLSTQITQFTDDASISSGARGYINEAVKLNIVQGFDDGSFQPSKKVTRAQMVTFLSRSENYLQQHSSREVTGYITQLTDTKIEISDDNANVSSYTMNDQTVIYDSNNKLTSSKFILPTNKVTIIQDQGNAYFIQLIDEKSQYDTLNGSLVGLNLGAMTISIASNGETTTYSLNSNVTVVDEKGNGLTFSSLANNTNDQVQLKRYKFVKDAKIIQIVDLGKGSPVDRTLDATVASVDAASGTISIQSSESATAETFVLSADVKVQSTVVTNVTLSDLQAGDTVKISIQNNQVTVITLMNRTNSTTSTATTDNSAQNQNADQSNSTQTNNDASGTTTNQSNNNTSATNTSIEGQFIGILDNATQSILTMTLLDGTPSSYVVSANAAVEITGMSWAGLSDLKNGDQIKADLNNNKITKIVVSNREIKTKLFSTVISYTSDTHIITVQNADNSLEVFQLKDNTTMKMNHEAITLKQSSLYFTVGSKVNLTTSNKDLISIEKDTYFDGVITNINLTTDEITVKVSQGDNTTFKLSATTLIEKMNTSNATIKDLQLNDAVKLIMSSSQEKVQTVKVQDSFIYSVNSALPLAKTMILRDNENAIHIYTISDEIALEYAGSEQISIADFTTGAPVLATFMGNTLQKITLLDTQYGKVTSIDSTNLTFSFMDYHGKTTEINAAKHLHIADGSTVYTTLNHLQVNDHIKLIAAPNGSVSITIMDPIQKVVSSYDVFKKILFLKRKTLDEPTEYYFTEDAYIHAGDQIIDPSTLMNNDNITIYMIDGKIKELVK